MAIITAIVAVANKGLDLNIPGEAIITAAGVVTAYIFGEAYVDGKQKQ